MLGEIPISEEDDELLKESAKNMITRLKEERNVFLNKFAKYLSPKEREYFMRKIRLIANELKQISLAKASIKSNSRGMRR